MSAANKDLADLRRQYSSAALRRTDLDENPFLQFSRWFDEALAAEVMDANAMSLSTVSAQGQPSLRTVLLKYFDESGFVFYTNLGSQKAEDIAANPRVALLFYWPELNRQIKILGDAQRATAKENLRYFSRRPKDSQLAAWVSEQSRVISARSVLENKFAEMKIKYQSGEVPLPSFWGGFRVVPHNLEFWQGRVNRLHDRFVYHRTPASAWTIDRLAP